MKTHSPVRFLLLLSSATIAAAADLPEAPAPMKVRTTAYTATERQGGGCFGANGARLRAEGAMCSAASDWSWLPLGTVFQIKSTGRTYRIEDYGSALVGRKTVDLYMASDRGMRAWGVRQLSIDVLKMGSFEQSAAILRSRTRSSHARKMLAALRSRLAASPLLAQNSEPIETALN